MLADTQLVAAPVSGGTGFGIASSSPTPTPIAHETTDQIKIELPSSLPPRNMKSSSREPQTFRKLISRILALGAAGATSLPAQVPATKESEIVNLTPFIVDTSKDTGYRAENTLSGSRLNTSLKDVSADISVFTREFMEDMAVHSLNEVLLFDANTQTDLFDATTDNPNAFLSADPNARNTFTSRGLPGGFTRNFVNSLLPNDTYNISRADLSKGPNGVLFGAGSIGGIVNASGNRAEVNRNKNTIELQVGSWGLNRAVLNVNRVLIKDKLAIRLDALEHHEEAYQYNSFKDQRRATLSVGYRPLKEISFNASYEKGFQNRSNQRPSGPREAVARWIAAGNPLASIVNSLPVANAAAGLSIAGAGTNLIFVDGVVTNRAKVGTTTTFLDASNSPTFVANYNGRRLYDDSSFGNLAISNRVATGGSDNLAANKFNSLDLSLEGRLLDKIDFSLNYVEELLDVVGHNTNDPTLQADPNAFIGGPQIGTGTGSPFASANLFGTNPHVGQFFFEDQWRVSTNFDRQHSLTATLAYELDFAKVGGHSLLRYLGRHRLAAMGQERKYAKRENQLFEALSSADLASGLFPGTSITSAEAGANRINHRRYVTFGDWKNFSVAPFPTTNILPAPQLGPNATVKTVWVPRATGTIGVESSKRDAFMGVLQSYFFHDHFVTTVGYRVDKINIATTVSARDNPANNPGGVTDLNRDGIVNEWVIRYDLPRDVIDVRAISRNLGAVYHINDKFSLTYNRSGGLDLPARAVRVAPGVLYSGERGTTVEYGVRFNLFNDRLSGGITRFDTAATDQLSQGSAGAPTFVNDTVDILSRLTKSPGNLLLSTAESDALRANFNSGLQDSKSHGYQVQLTGNVTRNLSLRVSYSKRETELTNILRDQTAFTDERVVQFKEILSRVGATIANAATPDGQSLLPTASTLTIADRLGQLTNDTLLRKATREGSTGQQPERLSATARYTVAGGRLKGFSVGTTFQWSTPKVIGRTVEFNDLNGNYVIDAGELPKDANGQNIINVLDTIKGKADTQLDMFATYRFKSRFLGNNASSIQLNVYNVLNDTNIIPSRTSISGSGYSQYSYSDPISFRVTFRTEF